ncbi:hypothetical protein U1708_11835 [Sphingomonas sp. ZB1N12]|uniref:hypothetical protein n=1 Tax=Sphingomonas arabinosi TaxID=3096160 RepID=UPI002FCB2BAB
MAIGVGVVLNGGRNRVTQVRTVRKDGWTAARREGFLLALSMTANVTTAAIGVGMTPSGAHALRRREPAFAALWAEALVSGYDRLEEALLMITLAGLRGEPAEAAGDGDSGGVTVGAAVAVAVVGDVGGDDVGGDDVGGDVGVDGGVEDDESEGGGVGGGAVGGGAVGDGPGDGGVTTVKSGAAAFAGPMPGFGAMHLSGLQAVQVGMSMLARFRAAQAGGGGGKRPQHRRATVSETNASIAKKLDSLAQRLRASSVEGEA